MAGQAGKFLQNEGTLSSVLFKNYSCAILSILYPNGSLKWSLTKLSSVVKGLRVNKIILKSYINFSSDNKPSIKQAILNKGQTTVKHFVKWFKKIIPTFVVLIIST